MRGNLAASLSEVEFEGGALGRGATLAKRKLFESLTEIGFEGGNFFDSKSPEPLVNIEFKGGQFFSNDWIGYYSLPR